jgi:hypothetical protein
MENEKKEQSTLDQIKELNKTDTIESVHFSEPELKEFAAENIFEVEKPAPVKKQRFGKRSERKASQVKIKPYDEEMPDFSEKEPVIDEVKEEDLTVEQTGRIDASSIAQQIAQDAEDEEGLEKTKIMQPISAEESYSESVVFHTLQPHTAPLEPQDMDVPSEDIEEILDESPAFENPSSPRAAISEELDYLDADPSSLELYMDKVRFNTANYPKIEEYLTNQSAQGYHLVQVDGKKYYFTETQPKDYYYTILYQRNEPSEEQWSTWHAQGWREVCRIPGKRKKDAGWIIVRNELDESQVQKEIDNDEEKLRYFKKQVSSYRSTLFLIFICMVCCCITAWLQFALYNGYYEILAGCAVVFVICFIAFMVYSRYLRINRKRAKLLRGKIKERKRQLEQSQAAKNDSQLDEEWNSLEEPKQKKKAKKMKKAKK